MQELEKRKALSLVQEKGQVDSNNKQNKRNPVAFNKMYYLCGTKK